MQHYQNGRFFEAETLATTITKEFPLHQFAWKILGAVFKETGRITESIIFMKKSVQINPKDAEAQNNLGVSLQELGKFDQAEVSFTKAINLEPNYIEAHSNLGNTYKDQGNFDKAIIAYHKAISINPHYAEAHYNIGHTYKLLGKLDKAIESYTKAIELNVNYAEAYNNLGNVFFEKGKTNESIEAYKNSILVKNNNHQAWHNIFYVLQCVKQNNSTIECFVSDLFKNTYSNSVETFKQILIYKLKRSYEIEEKDLEKTIDLISKNSNYKIKNLTNNNTTEDILNILPTKVISLVHFGRSGTGLLHSLIDHHEQLYSLPGIYLSEYFDYSTWEKITANGWDSIVDNFISTYEVLFDSSSKTPVLSKGHRYIRNIGYSDGFTNLGNNRDEKLKLNKNLFKQKLNELVSHFRELDQLSFFKLIHIAYDRTINNYNKKDVIFYHIHNPDVYSQLNLIHLDTNHNWIVMVREPIQSCESWIKNNFQDNDYLNCSMKITTMLLDVDNIIYTKQNAIGLRLEDLKKHPKKTIKALCDWMEIEENQNLYEMTMQGKKWWGDPTSPDYLKDGMKPFGQSSIKRKIGLVFTKRDQLILKTFFYPFNVRFGYIKENEAQFKKDLRTIRPMLNEVFDFEKKIIKETKVCYKDFMKSGSYLNFRSILIERWNLLNKNYTYKNIVQPLFIN